MDSSKKTIPASAFALSPPLSATAGASDCELDTIPPHAARIDSSPPSLPSSRARSRSPWTDEEPTLSQPVSRGQSRRPHGRDVETAFSLIRASWREALPDDLPCPGWCVLHISPPQYEQLCSRLRIESPDLLDHFENHLRFDYDPDRSELVLRLMANVEHDTLQDCVMDEIKAQTRTLATNTTDPVLKSLLRSIRSTGQAQVKLSTTRQYNMEARRRPDGQFRFRGTPAPVANLPYHFRGSATPQFLIEIGNSQKARALQGLAQDYYEKSRGAGIKTVLTINTHYVRPEQRKNADANADRTASYCLYRGPHRIHHNIVFRGQNGQQVDGSLVLFVSDFVPDEVLDQLPATLRSRTEKTIELPHAFLFQSLAEADYEQVLEDAKTPEPVMPPARPAKRVRWETTDEGDGAGADGGGEGASRSKRPRTRSVSRAQATANLAERRRTRSMSRGEAT